MAPSSSDHWPDLARRWNLLGSPLRPHAEDIRAYREAISARLLAPPPPRVLLLGVTPEIYHLGWPAGTDFQAADRARAMIDGIWPGPPAVARCEDWTALSLPDGSRDLAFCDGGFHLLPYPDGQAALVRSLGRVLAPGGLFVLRLFAPPASPESPNTVLRDLNEGRIPNSNLLKLRLAMALQKTPGDGVRLADVWDAFHAAEPDAARLAARAAWPVEEIRAVEAYRGSDSRYYFVSVEEACEFFCVRPGGFEVVSYRVPSYLLGERCPMLTLRRTEG